MSDPFTDGPALSPAADLLAWLKAQAGDQTLQIPVVITSSPLGITAAHLGAIAGPAPEGAIHLSLDQGALGIPLSSQLPQACSDGPCAVWLEGTWGSLVPGGPSGPGLGGPGLPGPGLSGPSMPGGPALPPDPSATAAPTRHPFAVRRYIGPVEGEVRAIRVAAD